MRARFIFTVLALLSANALAVVDMKNANYSDTFLDIPGNGSGFNMKMQQYYNSRSVYIGYFGYGRCSDFETAIEKLPEGRLKVQHCGAGQEIVFSLSKMEGKELDQVVQAILTAMKKKSPTLTEKFLADAKEQLLTDNRARIDSAKEFGIAMPEAKKGSVYTAEGLSVEQIVFDGNTYSRNLADGTTEKFDKQGHLISMSDKNLNSIKINYAGDRIKDIVDNNGRKFNFNYVSAKNLVESVSDPQGMKAEYKYKGEDLIELKNAWGNTYKFVYDDNHNLTKISYPDGTFKAITYDTKNDWVTSFAERVFPNKPACLEKYAYETDKANPKDHYWSTATKTCGKEVKNEAKFEFWYKSKSDGRKYLARVKTTTNSDTQDITYHPDFGRPTNIIENNMSTSFQYYPSGLVKDKITPNSRLAYEYKNEFNKVSKVTTEYLNDAGKVLKKRETTFQYDKKANMVAAANTDGFSVKLSHDVRGRIVSVIDQSKKEVQLKYTDANPKPTTIIRPKVGSITVVYKPNGEIDKVNSPEGPIVAAQVAATFNNVIDLIAPATSELN